MCGFAGILNLDGSPVCPKTLERMAAILQHRGPDDTGIETLSTTPGGSAHNLGFAFKRLAVIDLSLSGHQPMISDNRALVMVYNGEIYNANELRRTLELKGYQFHGTSDTEVILKLYEDVGSAAFAQLNGMFAIVIWDSARQRLLLVRDRMGIKPLHYTMVGSTLIFASEIKALFCHPQVKRAFDPVSVVDYMSFQFCLLEHTMFENIRLLPPATVQTYDLSKPQNAPTRQLFWRWLHRPDNTRSLDDFAEELRHRLTDTLARQIRSDVPVGTFLSSGMDTSAIAALATRLIPGMHSFTCGFDSRDVDDDEKLFDERQDAEALARLLGTQHHTLTLGADAMREYFLRTIWHMETPQAGISYQIMAMAETVKKHTAVVLSGTGGDELFAGYHWRYHDYMNIYDKKILDASLYRQRCRLLNDDTRWNVLSAKLRRDSDMADPRHRFNEIMAQCDSDDPLSRMLYFEVKGFLHALLQVDDKLNMAHSVEARVPFLDNEIIDLAQTIPSSMKYDGITAKIVLKKALRGILPDAVIDRRKQGFTPPEAYNMRNVNREWIEETLYSQHFQNMGLIKKEAAGRIVQEHMNGTHNHRFLLWSLLCLHGVQKLYIEDCHNRF